MRVGVIAGLYIKWSFVLALNGVWNYVVTHVPNQ